MAHIDDRPFSVEALFDDAGCDRHPQACELFSVALSTLRSPLVCDHLYRSAVGAPGDPIAMFICALHPQLVYCSVCLREHIEQGHAGPPSCAIESCVAPIVAPSRCDVVFASGRVQDLAESGAQLAVGMVGALAMLCNRHGGRHRWRWVEMVDVLADEGRAPSWAEYLATQGEETP